MSKFLDSFVSDILEKLKSPEVQDSLIKPIVSTVFNILYPYLFGIVFLWGIMFLCLAMILLILVRGSLVDIFRKE